MKKIMWVPIISIGLILVFVFTSHALAQGSRPIRIIFLHHSCGQNLIEAGNVREGLSDLGYGFFDHGYNGEGLRLADSSFSGECFNVPDDNTDPDGFAAIFSQPLHDPPDNTFSYLMEYDVIAFKSCYPTSNIGDDEQLADYQSYYLSIRETVDHYPQKLFVIVTPPPQVPNNTDPDEAQRARTFADWLGSESFLSGHSNLVTFDFFDLLAGEDHTLQASYRVDEWDAHPNDLANREIGPLFVAFLDTAIGNYFGEGFVPDDEIELPDEEIEEELEPEVDNPPVGNEMNLEEREWQPDTDGRDSSITCSLDPNISIAGEGSLTINYALEETGFASCAHFCERYLDWTGEKGVRFSLRSDRIGQELIFMVYSGLQDDPTPFEVRFLSSETSVDSWEEMIFSWDEFTKSAWVGEGGIDTIDPARIISFVFSLEAMEGTHGQFWVDGLSPWGEYPQEITDEDEQGGMGGICPFSTIVMPLLVGILWTVNRRREQRREFSI